MSRPIVVYSAEILISTESPGRWGTLTGRPRTPSRWGSGQPEDLADGDGVWVLDAVLGDQGGDRGVVRRRDGRQAVARPHGVGAGPRRGRGWSRAGGRCGHRRGRAALDVIDEEGVPCQDVGGVVVPGGVGVDRLARRERLLDV